MLIQTVSHNVSQEELNRAIRPSKLFKNRLSQNARGFQRAFRMFYFWKKISFNS